MNWEFEIFQILLLKSKSRNVIENGILKSNTDIDRVGETEFELKRMPIDRSLLTTPFMDNLSKLVCGLAGKLKLDGE